MAMRRSSRACRDSTVLPIVYMDTDWYEQVYYADFNRMTGQEV